MASAKILDVARLGVGASDLLATRTVAELDIGDVPDDLEIAVLRVLGARQIVQGTAQAFFGFRRVGVMMDVLHAVSMIALAAFGPKRLRRAALTQTTIASGFAVLGIVLKRRS
jgi:hypothetical protein